MRSEVVTLALAGAANLVGALVALVLFRRRRRRQQVARSPHPSARPPVHVALDAEADAIEVSVPSGAPDVAVDIVSVRHLDPPGPWEPAQLVEPVVVPPGGRAVFPVGSVHDRPRTALDVVVAWTARHATGDVTGSQLFRLPPERDEPAPAVPGGLGLLATAGMLVLLVASSAVVVVSIDDQRDSDAAVASVATDDAVRFEDVDVAAPPATAPGTPSTIAASSPPIAATTTTTPPTSAPTTTESTTTTTTTGPTDVGPAVDAVGRIAPCRFGDACLVVGFTIAGFEGSPGEYVCEFDDGSRFTFGFVGDGADTACSTGNADAQIVVEVAGVRSAPVTRP